MPIQKLRKYLDENKVKYVVISHSPVFTAQETAQNAHVSGKEMAKTIIVKIAGQTAMVVLPASCRINFEYLRELTGEEEVRLASEQEFKDMFPDCEVGAMPPFGNLYSLDVYVAQKLTEDDEIAFNAGNHRELIKMKYKDFDRLVHPTVLDLTLASSRW